MENLTTGHYGSHDSSPTLGLPVDAFKKPAAKGKINTTIVMPAPLHEMIEKISEISEALIQLFNLVTELQTISVRSEDVSSTVRLNSQEPPPPSSVPSPESSNTTK